MNNKVESDGLKLNQILITVFANASLRPDLAKKMQSIQASLVMPPIDISADSQIAPKSVNAIVKKKIESLKRLGYLECLSGVTPPHCIESQQNCRMLPPRMDPHYSPVYRYAFSQPHDPPKYEMDAEISGKPFAQQVLFYLDQLREIEKKCYEKFDQTKEFYLNLVKSFPTNADSSRTGDKATEHADELEELSLRLLRDYKEMEELELQAQRPFILSNRLTNNQSGEGWQMKQAIKVRVLCLREASDYVSAYAVWLKLEKGSEKVPLDPLKPDQQVPKYRAAQLGANAVPEMPYNCTIFPLEGSHSELHVTPSQHVKMSVSKCNKEGTWEKVPVFIRMSYGSSYDFKVILEHNRPSHSSVEIGRFETSGLQGGGLSRGRDFPRHFCFKLNFQIVEQELL